VTVTCRDEILEAFRNLELVHQRTDFALTEILEYMRRQGTAYRETTIRTHIVSRLCTNSPDHHAVVYPDLERVGRGVYRRK
jgi:hypothetical protein